MNWIQGVKHGLTPTTIFRNVWEWDRLREKSKAQCEVCDITIPSE